MNVPTVGMTVDYYNTTLIDPGPGPITATISAAFGDIFNSVNLTYADNESVTHTAYQVPDAANKDRGANIWWEFSGPQV